MYYIAGAGNRCASQVDDRATVSFLNDSMDVTCVNEVPTWQCQQGSLYFQSFAMLLTTEFEFLDWGNYQEEYHFLLSVVSFMFAVVVGILLLNILIAIVNNVFTKVTDESEGKEASYYCPFSFSLVLNFSLSFSMYLSNNF